MIKNKIENWHYTTKFTLKTLFTPLIFFIIKVDINIYTNTTITEQEVIEISYVMPLIWSTQPKTSKSFSVSASKKVVSYSLHRTWLTTTAVSGATWRENRMIWIGTAVASSLVVGLKFSLNYSSVKFLL